MKGRLISSLDQIILVGLILWVLPIPQLRWYVIVIVAVAVGAILEIQAARVAELVESQRSKKEREAFIQRVADENGVPFKQAEEWQKINEVLGITHEDPKAKSESKSGDR